jgi:hypothetical protein
MERRFWVTVRGHLDETFGAAFGEIETKRLGDTSVLSGRLTDAALLDGVLAYLRDLGVELIRVDTADATKTTSSGEPRAGESSKGDSQ